MRVGVTGANGCIDEVRIGARTVGPDDSPIDAPPGSVVVLSGWIIEEGTQAAGAAAFMLVNGRPLPTAYGFERPDVADVHGTAALRSGFVGRIDVDSLADDRAGVRLALLSRDGISLAELNDRDIIIARSAATSRT